MFKLSYFIFLLLFCHVAYGEVVQLGKCKDVKYLETFDLGAFTATWYEYTKYPLSFETGQKCRTTIYTKLSENEMSVENSAMYENTNTPVVMHGHAVVLGPGRLAVDFSETAHENPTENAIVLGTDYISWAFVYSCQESGNLRTVYACILTRDRKPTLAQIDSAKQVMADNDISQEELIMIDQHNCTELGSSN